jgi:hypothetical protein
MRNLLAALVGLTVLVACDPTKKDDMSCTASFQGLPTQVCSQLHITSAEGIVAEAKCTGDPIHGSWSGNACTTTNRIAGGYCSVDAKQYTLSGTDVKVFFYEPTPLAAAQLACAQAGGAWVTQ